MVVRKVLNSLLPEGGRYGGQEGFKLTATRRWPVMVVRKVLNSRNNEFKTFLTTITVTFW
jgi:hypothetical protein